MFSWVCRTSPDMFPTEIRSWLITWRTPSVATRRPWWSCR
jgi:hypothetical protein